MLTYLIRRHLPTALLAPLFVYSLILYAPGGVVWSVNSFRPFSHISLLGGEHVQPNVCTGNLGCMEDWYVWTFHLDNPWPLNYAAYIFDPGETAYVDAYGNDVPKGLDADIFGWHVRGSGALTGDFGKSFWIGRYLPVSELFSPDLDKLFAAIFTFLVSLTLAASIQQLRRARVYLRPGKSPLAAAERALRLAAYRQAQVLPTIRC
jgi:hypothetical protein